MPLPLPASMAGALLMSLVSSRRTANQSSSALAKGRETRMGNSSVTSANDVMPAENARKLAKATIMTSDCFSAIAGAALRAVREATRHRTASVDTSDHRNNVRSCVPSATASPRSRTLLGTRTGVTVVGYRSVHEDDKLLRTYQGYLCRALFSALDPPLF